MRKEGRDLQLGLGCGVEAEGSVKAIRVLHGTVQGCLRRLLRRFLLEAAAILSTAAGTVRSLLANSGISLLDPGQVHWLEVEVHQTGGMREYPHSPGPEDASDS